MHFRLLLVAGVIIAAATSTGQAFKEGCQDTCGNVSIPYPFGTKEGCYHDEEFLITCNTTSSPPKAFLMESNIEVTNISLDEGQLNILNYVAYDCYNKDGTPGNYSTPSFTLSKFKVSDSKNKFIAVGCDTYAYINGSQGDRHYISGCISICDNLSYVSNGSCSGIGCCQIPLPKGVDEFEITVGSYDNHANVSNFNLCSYAFVVQENTFNFSSSYLGSFQDERVPVVLDWAIGNETCAVANHSNTYACGNLSKCIDNDNGPGYHCSCLDGYQGNPYLPNGCQDIDECEDSRLNQCEKVCTNTIGNYTCSCPKGYHGDSWKGGHGCVRDQLFAIKIILSSTISVMILLVGFSWMHFLLKKRKLVKLKENFFKQNGGLMLQQQLSDQRERSSETTKIYTSEELEKATDFYAENKIIGRGGYGTVYKGVLADGKIVAIKKSKLVDQGQIEQFINEVIVVAQINHRNVVKLLGCCLETEVPLLVYEYIPNGTLHDHLHNRSMASSITWDICLKIAAETAGVLSYLHSSASIPIIHRDIKSTNILLDDNYTAKVSDFGASRLVPIDEMQLSTMVQGTLGYLDPEYLHTSQLTEKSDVYSFGVVLVELLTRRKVFCFDKPDKEKNLAMHFVASFKADRLFEILDECITMAASVEQLKEVANLARMCLSLKGEDRPTMKEVAMELEGLRIMKKHPWVNNYSEETEHLLGVPSDAFDNHQGQIEMTIGYD